VEVVVERVERGKVPPIWLFSDRTLADIPDLYEEISANQERSPVARFMFDTRVGGVRLTEWFSAVLVIAGVYLGTVLLNRLLTPLIGFVWRRVLRKPVSRERNMLPVPARLLILALVGRWVLSQVSLSLLARQFWSNLGSAVTIAATVWLLILLNGEVEAYIRRRVLRTNVPAAASLLRVLRRAVDVLVIFGGLLATLRLLSVDATAALAGLGVGGIAVALAAQKTLENVIAGASLVLDQAVRVGDFLKMGDVTGTVDHIGLRSTRIRTLDRTIVIVPNGQIASASLETISARDKYWFHHVVGLRYETTPKQLREVVNGIRRLLETHPSIDRGTERVRFFRLGSFSLDVEVVAYLHAREWNHFMEMQEQLLFSITALIDSAGTAIAMPSQMTYLASPHGSTEGGRVPAR
jgi:MscS family membrane protein